MAGVLNWEQNYGARACISLESPTHVVPIPWHTCWPWASHLMNPFLGFSSNKMGNHSSHQNHSMSGPLMSKSCYNYPRCSNEEGEMPGGLFIRLLRYEFPAAVHESCETISPLYSILPHGHTNWEQTRSWRRCVFSNFIVLRRAEVE